MELIKDFQPPDGTRLIFHSSKAKAVWEPRIQKIANAHSERERQTVVLGMRNLTLQPISRGFEYERIAEWARNHGLAIMPVRAVGRFDGFAHRYTQGDDMYVTAIATKPEYAEDSEPEKHLGYPSCCSSFFAANFPKYIDPMWQWSGGNGESREVTIQANPYSNPLLRYWSLRYVSHIPCSPNCKGSIKRGQQFETLMPQDEREWLSELLSGKIRWSCLHGVAEIHTEHFRIICPSNPSAKKYEIFCN